jgi:hypothetical protein
MPTIRFAFDKTGAENMMMPFSLFIGGIGELYSNGKESNGLEFLSMSISTCAYIVLHFES